MSQQTLTDVIQSLSIVLLGIAGIINNRAGRK